MEGHDEPAVLFWVRDQLDTMFVCSLAGEQIMVIHTIRNPDKLVYIQHLSLAWRPTARRQ